MPRRARSLSLVALAAAAGLCAACARGGASGVAAAAGQCDVPISFWLVAGSFPVDTGALRLDKLELGDPATVLPAAGDSAAGATARVWREVLADSLGRVDLSSALPDPSLEDRAAYALTYLSSPEPRSVRLAVESDDDVVVWLNGRRLHRNEIGRELRSATDTITLPLARGVNRLLYRVVNRGGGFGLGGRLLTGASRDPAGDLRADVSVASRTLAGDLRPGDTATGPSPRQAVTLGPALIESRARIDNRVAGRTRLVAPLRVCVTRWSGDAGDVTLAVGAASVRPPKLAPRSPVVVSLDADWAELARGVLRGGARVVARRGGSEISHLALPASANQLLTMLSRPMTVARWSGTRRRGARTLGLGRSDVAIAPGADSATRERVGALETRFEVPDALGGLSLDAYVSEFAGAPAVANGVAASGDSLGRVTLCAPCRDGASVTLALGPIGAPWWDPPLVRVRELGWREVRDGAEWARYFTGDSAAVAIPDSAVATRLLRAALDGSKREYRAELDAWVARLAPISERVRRDTIDAVGHSHIDAAWLWRWREGVDVIRATWATTAKLIAKYPDMHFAASSAQHYAWLERYDPALLGRVQALARRGRWDPVGGWWIEADANLPSGESLVRQGLYGQRTYMRLFGRPSRVAWLPNSFGFAWSLPQILRKSGFEFFVTQEMRWNDTNRWPPRLNAFWWEGPDGSRVFTDMLYAYDHDLVPRRLAKEFVVTRDSSATRRLMAVYGVGDHGGGPTMETMDRARDLRRVPAFPVFRDASPDSTLSRMRRDVGGAGPVVRDELYLEYHRGTYTTQAAVKRRNRELESLLGAAEAAAAIAPATAAYPRDSLRAAWERVLFNQFHDILPGTAVDSVYRDAMDDYAHADSIARRVLRTSLTAIAASLDTRPPVAGGVPYVVFNWSGRRRSDVVRIPAAAGDVVRDGAGTVLPSVVRDSVLEAYVPHVPALGATVIFVGRGGGGGGAAAAARPTPPPPAGGAGAVLENDRLLVEIDARTGSVARLYDKVNRRESVAPGAGGLLLIEDRPQLWDAWNIDNLRGERAWVDDAVRVGGVVRTPLGVSVAVHRERGKVRVDQRYELRFDADRLDVATRVEWREAHRMLKVAVPLAFRVDSTRAEIPYASIARPTRPRVRRDSARFETPMQRWVDASARDYGVAVVNDGKYGYSASGDTVFVTLLRSPKYPDPNADMGTHHFTYSLVPHAGDWRAEAVRQGAVALNQPMIALPVAAHAGSGREIEWVAIDGQGVELGALKRAEDDDRQILRLVETTGRATTARLGFTTPVIARDADLLERPLDGGYEERGVALRVPLRPFEIRTLAIEPARRALAGRGATSGPPSLRAAPAPSRSRGRPRGA